MGVWQFIWIGLMVFSLCANAFLHGKETKTNFWAALISVALQGIILGFGGFFTAG